MSGIEVLAWMPFLEPSAAMGQLWWLLVVPLTFGIAMVHRACRCTDLTRYWREVLGMTVTSLVVMTMLGVGIWAVLEWALPAIPVG